MTIDLNKAWEGVWPASGMSAERIAEALNLPLETVNQDLVDLKAQGTVRCYHPSPGLTMWQRTFHLN